MKKIKKIFNKILAIHLTVLMVIFSLIPPKTHAQDYGSEEDLRSSFVSACEQFAAQHEGNACYYTYGPEREVTYRNGQGSGSYKFDCVGWVSCAYHWFLGLGGESFTYFATPQSLVRDTAHFELVNSSSAVAGDILIIPNHHVAVYCGEEGGTKYVVDMWQNSNTGGLRKRAIGRGGDPFYAYSGLSYTLAAHLYSFDGVEFSPVVDGDTSLGTFKPQGEINYEIVDLDELEFEFAGNPAKMEYNGEVEPNPWLFSRFSQFVDLILGLMLAGIRSAIVGWGIIIENFINSVYTFLSYGE